MRMLSALLITLLAGLMTTLGALIVTQQRFLRRGPLSLALAFAAGAMLFLAFAELVPHGLEMLDHVAEDGAWPLDGRVAFFAAFFVGIALIGLIDRFMPHKHDSPIAVDEAHDAHERSHGGTLGRSGILLAAIFALHNLPEGFALFFTAEEQISVGILLAAAIAAHNIPAGIAIAAPIYASTKSRVKALFWATAAGMSQLVGGLIGLLLISNVLPESFMGVLYGLVAGMMVFIALDELLPAARRYETKTHRAVYGLLVGMVIVAVSLLLIGEHHH